MDTLVVVHPGCVSASCPVLGKRHEHALCTHEGVVYLFGGLKSRFFNSIATHLEPSVKDNDLLFFNPETGGWKKITHLGPDCPAGRYGHTLTSSPCGLVLYGGHSERSPMCDIWLFDVQLQTWLELSPEEHIVSFTSPYTPSPDGSSTPPLCVLSPTNGRANHGAVMYENELIIFGGCSENTWLNDVWAFDISKRTWRHCLPREQICNLDGAVLLPCPRDLHATTIFNNRLWIHSGWSKGAVLNDLWSFHLKKSQWECHKMLGNLAPARYRHCGVLIPETGSWFIHGGRCASLRVTSCAYEIDLENGHVRRVELPLKAFQGPDELCGHRGVGVQFSKRETVVCLTGGMRGDNTTNHKMFIVNRKEGVMFEPEASQLHTEVSCVWPSITAYLGGYEKKQKANKD